MNYVIVVTLVVWVTIALILIVRPQWLAMLRGESVEVLESRPGVGWRYVTQVRVAGAVLLLMAVFILVSALVGTPSR